MADLLPDLSPQVWLALAFAGLFLTGAALAVFADRFLGGWEAEPTDRDDRPSPHPDP